MMVQAKFAAIKGIRLHEALLRFAFGGAACVAAGLIAKRFGPEIGGLFLAFPAIFPAGACLVEAHEKQHKARAGIDGTNRGRVVASIDAAGAAIGAIGLTGFGLVCWLGFERFPALAVFTAASLTWTVIAVSFWLLRKGRKLRGLSKLRDSYRAFRTQ